MPTLLALLLTFGIFVGFAGADTLTDLPTNEGIRRLLEQSPWAVVIFMIVKWFMSHIDTMKREFLATLEKKDAAFTALADECHKQFERQFAELMALFKELRETK